MFLGGAWGCLGSHAHPREAALALTPHTHTPVAFGQAGEGLTWLDGGGKGYGYNSIKTELLLYI